MAEFQILCGSLFFFPYSCLATPTSVIILLYHLHSPEPFVLLAITTETRKSSLNFFSLVYSNILISQQNFLYKGKKRVNEMYILESLML